MRKRWLLIAAAILTVILTIAIIRICAYYSEWNETQQQISSLREIYYENAVVDGMMTYVDHPSEASETGSGETKNRSENAETGSQDRPENPDSASNETQNPQENTEETEQNPAGETGMQSASPTLIPTATPRPQVKANKDLEKVRRVNKDVAAWITIQDKLDEPIMKKDNKVYLNHDYKGRKNDNGALFFEETCQLGPDSEILIVYGHNMKTGARFGFFHEYFDLKEFQEHCIVKLDTMDENAVYVVYAVGKVPVSVVEEAVSRTANDAERKGLLNKLEYYNIYQTRISVTEEDRLLLLVTCMGNDDERSILACRKLREDENEKDIYNEMKKAHMKSVY